MKTPLLYINHILDAINKIQTYTEGMNEQSFLLNDLVKDAVIRNFEVIGEATKKMDDSFKTNHPEVPWKNMAGMRDKLIHDYAGIDYWIVWNSVLSDIPLLKKLLENVHKKYLEGA